jgi:hypothetical protein
VRTKVGFDDLEPMKDSAGSPCPKVEIGRVSRNRALRPRYVIEAGDGEVTPVWVPNQVVDTKYFAQ